MESKSKKIRSTFKLDIESEMEDVKENDEKTLKYCLYDDLEELGVYNINSCEILKNGMDKETLQKVIDKLTDKIDLYQNKLNKLIASNKIDGLEENRQQTKINGMKIALETVCGMYREVDEYND